MRKESFPRIGSRSAYPTCVSVTRSIFIVLAVSMNHLDSFFDLKKDLPSLSKEGAGGIESRSDIRKTRSPDFLLPVFAPTR